MGPFKKRPCVEVAYDAGAEFASLWNPLTCTLGAYTLGSYALGAHALAAYSLILRLWALGMHSLVSGL